MRAHHFESDNELVKAVLGRIEDFIYFVDINGDGSRTVRYVGPHLEKVLGISRELFTADPFSLHDRVHPDDQESVAETALRLKTEKKPQTLIYRFYNDQQEKYTWLEESVFPQVDEQGRHHAYLGIFRNVSERVERENA
ncbi:MAG TPA: PAS domain-containing protein, partial [Bacteroidia bacterium]|nr:PAS domain-containing protein [Bacteroidia bacterium]